MLDIEEKLEEILKNAGPMPANVPNSINVSNFAQD